MKIACQISPEARSAYFHQWRDVALAEAKACFPDQLIEMTEIGTLSFLETEASEGDLPGWQSLSFVQGLFERQGDLLRPLDMSPDWNLHEDFVFGSKFRGKTNERLTQMLINVGLASLPEHARATAKLLDPMAGRATTLLWAMRYGLKSWGVEADAKALPEVRQIVKKWSKIHRQKHDMRDGQLGNIKKKNSGQFIEFSTAEASLRLAHGDAREVDRLYPTEKFDLIVSDLPYGVQHFAGDNTRNPLDLISACLPSWDAVLKKHGRIVLAFNSYQPKRAALETAFEEAGFAVEPFTAAHRMSESIVREVLVARRA